MPDIHALPPENDPPAPPPIAPPLPKLKMPKPAHVPPRPAHNENFLARWGGGRSQVAVFVAAFVSIGSYVILHGYAASIKPELTLSANRLVTTNIDLHKVTLYWQAKNVKPESCVANSTNDVWSGKIHPKDSFTITLPAKVYGPYNMSYTCTDKDGQQVDSNVLIIQYNQT